MEFKPASFRFAIYGDCSGTPIRCHAPELEFNLSSTYTNDAKTVFFLGDPKYLENFSNVFTCINIGSLLKPGFSCKRVGYRQSGRVRRLPIALILSETNKARIFETIKTLDASSLEPTIMDLEDYTPPESEMKQAIRSSLGHIKAFAAAFVKHDLPEPTPAEITQLLTASASDSDNETIKLY